MRWLAVLALSLSSVCQAAPARIALVIDDIGNHIRHQQLVDLPAALTFSILPHTPHSRYLAEYAHWRGREVLMHVPMAAEDPARRLGPGALLLDMDPPQIQASLNHSLASVPHARGISNHMGSLFTTRAQSMQAVLHFVRQNNLYYLDSRTTARSQAVILARQIGVPVLQRHVFLDNVPNQAAIEGQFQQLLRLARRRGTAIGIAHPYPQTLAFLRQRLPSLAMEGIQLVPLSSLFQLETAAQVAASSNEIKRKASAELVPQTSGQG